MVDRWVEQTEKAVTAELAEVRTRIDVPDVEVVVGTGPDWSTAMDSVPWRPGRSGAGVGSCGHRIPGVSGCGGQPHPKATARFR